MSIQISPLEVGWVKKFFSGRNQLRWDSIETQEAPPKALSQVVPWLKKLGEVPLAESIVLPLYALDGRITWYAMAPDPQRFSQLVDEINGFIGPSYSDFLGERAELRRDDPSEQALAERFGTQVIRFAAQQVTDQQHIENALTLYRSVLSRRPDTPDRTRRPFGRIRADFDLALLAGNSGRAEVLLEELIASGRVNAEQRKCLEIRLLAGLGRIEELANNHALIVSVSDLSLPVQTLVDIVTALYETFVIPIEGSPDLTAILDAFRRHVSKPFGSLFRERKGIRHPKVLKAFLLFELVQPEPSISRCRSILAAYPESGDGYGIARTWCETLKETSTPVSVVQPASVLSQAKQAIADEDYETAVTLCLGLIPSQWAFSALLRCAVELDSVETTKKVLDIFDSASVENLNDLTDKDRARLEKLRRPRGKTELWEKSGWVNWAQSVVESPASAPSVSALREIAAKWSVEDYASDVKRCKELANLIGNADGDAEVIFRDAFPVLVDFFTEGNSLACRTFKAIFATLIKVLGWSGNLSSDELEIGFQLMHSVLSAGPTKEEYADSLEDFREIVIANGSPTYFDWSLNLAELLVLYPAPDDGASRLRIFMEVVGMLRMSPHRVTAAQREILSVLAKDYGCTALLDTFPQVSSGTPEVLLAHNQFSGLIGIYTLTEGAGQRAREILLRMFPSANVEVNCDDVSTNRLTSLAKNADIFVFAWKSSKHQAYYCVKDARGTKEIILPTGKGSASIVTSLLERIREG